MATENKSTSDAENAGPVAGPAAGPYNASLNSFSGSKDTNERREDNSFQVSTASATKSTSDKQNAEPVAAPTTWDTDEDKNERREDDTSGAGDNSFRNTHVRYFNIWELVAISRILIQYPNIFCSVCPL
jgi:hypothetical protein